ncbi:MAG: hypothetical protein AB8B79_10870 [Granulosicoccus sp.]
MFHRDTYLKKLFLVLLTLGSVACATDQATRQPSVMLPQPNQDTTINQETIEKDHTLAEDSSQSDQPGNDTNKQSDQLGSDTNNQSDQPGSNTNNESSSIAQYSIGPIAHVTRTGELQNSSLTEVSGISTSLQTPGVLFALNDSGNSAEIYAFSERGTHLGKWPIKASNRDWEDMASIWLDNQAYLIIGETGDNLKRHRRSAFYLVEEPIPGQTKETTLSPYKKLSFVYEDGPRNVEAFSVDGNSIFLISKEPVTQSGPAASQVYELEIPRIFDDKQLIAKKVASLPKAPTNFEAKLAAAMAGVDLNHITALDFDSTGNTAYLLTYRHVIRINRQQNQSWADAFTQRGERIYAHNLEQAEALSVADNRAIWITSEKRPAPLWAIPITPPL